MDDQNYLQIGDIAKICGVSVQALRHYQKISLIEPEHTNDETGYRYYSKNQIFNITIIKTLQNAGFSLQEIKDFLKKEKITDVTALYNEKLNEIQNEITTLLSKKNKIESYIDFFSNMLKPLITCKDEDLFVIQEVILETMPLISVRDNIKFDYPSMMFLYNKLVDNVFKNSLIVDNRVFSVFHGGYDNIYHNYTDIELAFEVLSPQYKAKNNIDKGRYLKCIHKGKYPASLQTVEKMQDYAQKNNYKIISPVIHRLIIPIAATGQSLQTVFEIFIKIQEK